FRRRKSGGQLPLVADALAIELVLSRALQRDEHDVLFVERKRFADLAELPARLAFNVQQSQWSFDHFHDCILLVVFDGQLAVEWSDLDCVAMNAGSGGRDLEIDRL